MRSGPGASIQSADMVLDQGREQLAADSAALALLGLSARVAALADLEWHSPAATAYRASIAALAAQCDGLRIRLAAYMPETG